MESVTQVVANSVSPDLATKNIRHKRRLSALAVWAVLGFLAAQSFTLSPITGYICLVPLTVALFTFKSDIAWRNSLLLLALFWSTDNAVLNYGATLAPIRYLVYLTVIMSFFTDAAVRLSVALAVCLALVFYLTIALFGTENISTTQLMRDIQLLLLLGLFFGLKAKQPFRMDMQVLMVAMTAYLLSECVNFFLLRSIWLGEYMRYDTTKYLIVLPSLVALLARRSILSFCFLVATFPVLVGYTTRTLFVSYVLVIFCVLLFFSIRAASRKRLTLLMVAALSPFVLKQFDYVSLFESFKSLNMMMIIQSSGGDVLQSFDPVRYMSNALFFERSLLEILFGRGFGSGLPDSAGLFSFVDPDQSAFTVEELNSSYFYNFHDVWLDVGLRFGLLPFGAFLAWIAMQRPAHSREGLALWLTVFIGIMSAFYSISGLISIFFLLRVVTSYRSA